MSEEKQLIKLILKNAAQLPFSNEELCRLTYNITEICIALNCDLREFAHCLKMASQFLDNGNNKSIAFTKQVSDLMEMVWKKPGSLPNLKVAPINNKFQNMNKCDDDHIGITLHTAEEADSSMQYLMKSYNDSLPSAKDFINNKHNEVNVKEKQQMTPEEFFEFQGRFFVENMEITKRKNADYTGQSGDAFANFTGVEVASSGVVDTYQGFLTRMHDKFARISSFVKNNELLVQDESVSDTLADFANSCSLFAGFIESRFPCKAHSRKNADGMTPEEFFEFQRNFYKESTLLTQGRGDNIFGKFTTVGPASSGAVTTQQNFLVKLHDKYVMISSIIGHNPKSTKLAVIINVLYAMASDCSLFAGYIEKERLIEEEK